MLADIPSYYINRITNQQQTCKHARANVDITKPILPENSGGVKEIVCLILFYQMATGGIKGDAGGLPASSKSNKTRPFGPYGPSGLWS